MKATIIKKAKDELTQLLNDKQVFNSHFPEVGDKLKDTPISPAKAFFFTAITCKKLNRKIPKISFVSSKLEKDSMIFPEVKRIFLIRHDVKTFLESLANYINPDNKELYSNLLSAWEEKEKEKGKWITK